MDTVKSLMPKSVRRFIMGKIRGSVHNRYRHSGKTSESRRGGFFSTRERAGHSLPRSSLTTAPITVELSFTDA